MSGICVVLWRILLLIQIYQNAGFIAKVYCSSHYNEFKRGHKSSLSNYCQKVMRRLDHAVCLTESLMFTLDQCTNFKAMRHESTTLNRTVTDKSHH